MSDPRILGIIPARGGSKGIPGKNLRPLAGRPLIAHTIAGARASRTIGRVVVSTDDEAIARVAREHGAEVVMRPAELSGDTASSEAALLHVLDHLRKTEGYVPRITVFLQCTSPLATVEDIDGTIDALEREGADSALAVAPFHHFLWKAGPGGEAVALQHDPRVRPMRQQREAEFRETGAVYALRTEGFLAARHRFFGRTVFHVMPLERSLEIDEPEDLRIAEMILTARDGGAPAAAAATSSPATPPPPAAAAPTLPPTPAPRVAPAPASARRRALTDWLLPPAALNLARTAAAHTRHALRTSGTEKRLLAANASLRDRHRGERCFIVATGPSIKTQDLSPLARETVIAVSNFFVHPGFRAIAPRYYCIPPWHAEVAGPAWTAWLGELAPALRSIDPCDVFVGLEDRTRIPGSGFREGQLHYLAFAPHLRPSRVDLAGLCLAPKSVTIMALQVALFLGFGEIQLLGCDHDWILHLNESRHFYAEAEHAAQRAGYDEWFTPDFAAHCRDYLHLWEQYRTLDAVARSRSVRILNATAGGLLDVFPRAAFPPAAPRS
jgi:CMP-N-acetylneuraminic acid synthetase